MVFTRFRKKLRPKVKGILCAMGDKFRFGYMVGARTSLLFGKMIVIGNVPLHNIVLVGHFRQKADYLGLEWLEIFSYLQS